VTDIAAEAAWVRSAQAGSADAFGRLVHMHQQGLRAFLRRLSGNAADADDLAQDTFVFAWEHIGRFEAGRSFRPWLFGIAWRKQRERKRSWLRLVKRETAAATPDTGFTPDPGLKLDLVKAAGCLPLEQRAAVLLCLGAEFTHAEAAEALAMPLGTVKSHVARGREKLAVMLGGSNG
jgi:RNA polymerase sigma-70 factor (ECF subfamily)